MSGENEKGQLTMVEEMMTDLENHHFVTTNIIVQARIGSAF